MLEQLLIYLAHIMREIVKTADTWRLSISKQVQGFATEWHERCFAALSMTHP